jgi:hypothetical protein
LSRLQAAGLPMSDSFRKVAPCIVCANLYHDERDKEIHGLGLCGKHHQAHLRRRKRLENGNAEAGIIADRHITQELRAHQFLAEKFQKFLHVLNHENITLLLSAEQIQEIRLMLNPVCVRSQRIAVPRSLPLEVLIDVNMELGDTSPQNCEATVALGALGMAREARKREIAETVAHQREQQALAFEIITAGFDELSREKYHDGERFKQLTLAIQLLRSLVGRPKTISDADQLSEGVDEDEDIPTETEK